MEHNWYETTVSAIAPHVIISVVDWASDSALPIPDVPREPGTYNVFAWGLNDPTEGNRSVVKENFDILASPIGWHSLPYAHDPDVNGKRQGGKVGKPFYRNTTTTWGNNVGTLFFSLTTRCSLFFNSVRCLLMRIGKALLSG
jgi:extracellular elastinolytic metalloproteinase